MGLKQIKNRRALSLPARIQLWDHVQMTAQRQSGAAGPLPSNSEIMKALDQRSFQFQECYEMALLRDEKLSGKIVFLLKLDQSKVQKTRLKFDGEGSLSSRRALLSCLYQEIQKLVFPQNKQKLAVKFSLIFGI